MTSSRGWCSLLRCALQRLPRARSDLALSTLWASVRDRTAPDEVGNVIPGASRRSVIHAHERTSWASHASRLAVLDTYSRAPPSGAHHRRAARADRRVAQPGRSSLLVTGFMARTCSIVPRGAWRVHARCVRRRLTRRWKRICGRDRVLVAHLAQARTPETRDRDS